ncbi:MAG: polysaccharide biosynthesis C-terminal domain-containing protein, partial [Solirubrobacterales bacterium]
AFTSEVVKADGRPDVLPRMHAVTLVVGAACMLALLPLDLIGIVVGFSIGWMAGGIYGMRRAAGILEIPLRELWDEVFPPLLAALLMAAALTPLEFLVVQSDSHGTVGGLALLAAEGLLGGVIYLALLSVFAPGTRNEVFAVGRGMLRRVRGTPVEADPAGVPVAGAAVKEGR